MAASPISAAVLVLALQVGADHPGALGGEAHRAGPADAGAGAGDDGAVFPDSLIAFLLR
jgi:hypothetical protein